MIVLNGTGTIADVVALADRRDQVSVSPEVARGRRPRIRRRQPTSAHDSPPTDARPVSGRIAVTPVLPDDKDYGMRLLRSHAADAGDPLDDQNGSRDARGATRSALCPGSGARSQDPRRPRANAQRGRPARAPALRLDRNRGPRGARRHGADVDRRAARHGAVDSDGPVGRRQRAAFHEQQRADRRAQLSRRVRAGQTRTRVERDLHAQFPCARRQPVGVLGGRRTGRGRAAGGDRRHPVAVACSRMPDGPTTALRASRTRTGCGCTRFPRPASSRR